MSYGLDSAERIQFGYDPPIEEQRLHREIKELKKENSRLLYLLSDRKCPHCERRYG